MTVWIIRSISTNRLVAVAAGETLDSIGHALTGHWSAHDCEAAPLDSLVLFSDPSGGAVVPVQHPTAHHPGTPGHCTKGSLDVLGAHSIACRFGQNLLWGDEGGIAWQPVDPAGNSPATRFARLMARADGGDIVEQLMFKVHTENADLCELLAALPDDCLPDVPRNGPFAEGT
jgi:hypothetical protein